MSLLTLAIWLTGIISFVGLGIAILPDGSAYPLPNEIITGTQTLYSWLYSLNNIFPVDTLIRCVAYGVLIYIVLHVIWPSLVWLFKLIRGTDN